MGCLTEIDNFRKNTNRNLQIFVLSTNHNTMKKLILAFLIVAVSFACSENEKERYTGRQQDIQLYQSSDFDFTGTLMIRELTSGKIELEIELNGPTSESDYTFPAHLHFGSYEEEDAVIASILTPISANTLKSTTEISILSDGSAIDYERMRSFDGHVKIHLANEGPDYQVILVAGNVGPKSMLGFDRQKVSVCGNSF